MSHGRPSWPPQTVESEHQINVTRAAATSAAFFVHRLDKRARGVLGGALMLPLITVSLIWAFSFGLTKGRLAGVDSAWVSAIRIAFAAVVFSLFWKPALSTWDRWLRLAGIGALQFGFMYLALNASYRHLQAYEVALFTLTTPVILALAEGLVRRSMQWKALVAAALAVVAGALVTVKSADVQGTLHGVLLVQAANGCFALGQLLYRRERAHWPQAKDHDLFAMLYFGALAVTLPVAAAESHGQFPALSLEHWLTLAYLGVIASGLGFFLWNVGATRVGTGTLAVMNNAKVPSAILVSVLVFGEVADWTRLSAAITIMVGAVIWSHRPEHD